tara:strand:+ start:1041 stop:1421 length:381 start_codon:yes stop_codon:yes gene_type:complete
MVTKIYSSASNADNDPMEKFEASLIAGNKCLTNVAQSNQSVRRTIDDAMKKFFASHDHLSQEIKDQFLRFSGVLVVELEIARKQESERDQKLQAIYEMTEKISDLFHARFGYPIPAEGDYIEEIDD